MAELQRTPIGPSWTPSQSASPLISTSIGSSTTPSRSHSNSPSTPESSPGATSWNTSVPSPSHTPSSTSQTPTTRSSGTTYSRPAGTSVSPTNLEARTSTTNSSRIYTSKTYTSSTTSSTTTSSSVSTYTSSTPSRTIISTTTLTSNFNDNDNFDHTHNDAHYCQYHHHNDNNYYYHHNSSSPQDVITDGSFEDVSFDSIGVLDAASGDWTVSGDAFFDQNSGTDYDTPDGVKFVYILPRRLQHVRLKRLAKPDKPRPNTFYTLTYDYAIPYVADPPPAAGFSSCSLTLQVGDPSNTDLVYFFGDTAQPAWGHSVSLDFLAEFSDLVFSPIWDCSGLEPGNEIDFALDNVIFTGAQGVEGPV
ncbi:uncharacterized protein Z519_08922 [Cladophialophora bantiana CBS 173.52]|uniref:Unplaced genomic scaffold supercont1.14, whole genome shotgun sequence n=1 Tax=Cladophialophora bantiana (strain ATCC 10958 / CBS 173.52 / CDC B-1940 / NIH 8579) TaxID=1442370 RepID=A0A0D2HAH4_CLAB1|nr:uncharacterized protein Z519_08922 [Cladophialophora bantiana CBS 173.52]KIW90278.1 hypothetical protein Z519_08922 [Cladophialophora bantiana CBS 173.52]